MQSNQVVLRDHCDCSGAQTRRRRLLLAATAGGGLNNLRRPHVMWLAAGCALLVVVVSALAFSVAAYAAPRDRAAKGKGQVRSESSRLLTGDQASLRCDAEGAVATADGPYIRWAPVTGGTPYPAGTVVDTANCTVTIPTPPSSAFLDCRLDGYKAVGDSTLKTMQVAVCTKIEFSS